MALSIWVPFAYISALVGGMLLFSKYQRYKKKAALIATEAWFPTHPERDLYITLLQASQSPPTSPDAKIDDRILMSALLSRAVTDVERIWSLRDTRPLLAALIQKGSLNEETQAKFAAAEKELEAEVMDVVNEANSFREGWGSYIFASASEMGQRKKMMEIVRDIPNVKAEEERKLPNPTLSSLLTPSPSPQPSNAVQSSPSSAVPMAVSQAQAQAAGLATPTRAGSPGLMGASPSLGSVGGSPVVVAPSLFPGGVGPSEATATASGVNVSSSVAQPMERKSSSAGASDAGSAGGMTSPAKGQGTPSKSTPSKKKKGKK